MRNDKLPRSPGRCQVPSTRTPPRPCCATGLLGAELRELEERVTAHPAAIPASWSVDGVTGPQAGRAGFFEFALTGEFLVVVTGADQVRLLRYRAR
jgi:hypothetical protein